MRRAYIILKIFSVITLIGLNITLVDLLTVEKPLSAMVVVAATAIVAYESLKCN